MAASGLDRGTCREEPVLPRFVRAVFIIVLFSACCLLTSSPSLDTRVQLFAAGADDPPAVTVTVIADGREVAMSTEPVTVAELLASARIALGELDRVEPALDELVAEGAVVRVTRVTCERVTREIEIPMQTRARYDRRVRGPITVREGSPGRAVAELEVWSKDGVETRQTVLSQRILEPMRPQVVVRGPMSLPSRGGQVLYMEATGYDPGPRSCGRYASGRTAIGLKAGKGVVAVDPRIIPLGIKLYVEGYGECVTGDVGSAIKGRRIDLGFDGYREALAWGRRTVKVTVLE